MRKKKTVKKSNDTTIRLKKEARKKLLIASARYTALNGTQTTNSDFLSYLCEKYVEFLDKCREDEYEYKRKSYDSPGDVIPPPPPPEN